MNSATCYKGISGIGSAMSKLHVSLKTSFGEKITVCFSTIRVSEELRIYSNTNPVNFMRLMKGNNIFFISYCLLGKKQNNRSLLQNITSDRL